MFEFLLLYDAYCHQFFKLAPERHFLLILARLPMNLNLNSRFVWLKLLYLLSRLLLYKLHFDPKANLVAMSFFVF
uniref:Uncharacterized protein n=1 Tax=Rhizophora mucronata TaxID=61149 RepID=A0A2P2PEP8_RHIMU